MKCLYCQSKCEDIYWDDLQTSVVEVWACQSCPNKVLFVIDRSTGELTQTRIAVTLKDKAYSVQFLHWSNVCRVNLLSRRDDITGITHHNELIKEFQFHPDITPSNIHEKLPTIITFS